MHIKSTQFNAWRIVEDQSRSTTRKYVDSANEHEILEDLLDKSKPKIKFYNDEIYFKNLHYLLSTPFRYPPLKWGSRFGQKIERGLLYASENLTTAMSEIAFYKLAFLRATEGNIKSNTISYTAFNINISSNKYIDLCNKPFSKYTEQISSKTNYQDSQLLGTNMRHHQIESFRYKSARAPKCGYNFGIFTPKSLQDNQNLENTFKFLRCYYTKEIVEFSFKQQALIPTSVFPINLFLINGLMPLPVE